MKPCFKRGATVHRLAQRFGVTKRTVYRWLQQEEFDLDRTYQQVMNGAWCSAADIAETMKCSKTTVYRLFEEGFLTGLKVGRTIRFRVGGPETPTTHRNFTRTVFPMETIRGPG